MQSPNKETATKSSIDAAVRRGEYKVLVDRLSTACAKFITTYVSAPMRIPAAALLAMILSTSSDLATYNAITLFDKRARKYFNRAYLSGILMGVILGLIAVLYGGMIGLYFGQYLPF